MNPPQIKALHDFIEDVQETAVQNGITLYHAPIRVYVSDGAGGADAAIILPSTAPVGDDNWWLDVTIP